MTQKLCMMENAFQIQKLICLRKKVMKEFWHSPVIGLLLTWCWCALTAAAAAAARLRPMMAAMEKSVALGLLMAAALEAATTPGIAIRGVPEPAVSMLAAGASIIDPSNIIKKAAAVHQLTTVS